MAMEIFMSDKLICFLLLVIDVGKNARIKKKFGGQSLIRNFNEFLIIDSLATDLDMFPEDQEEFCLI